MKIIISPAKKMNRDPDSLPVAALPEFLPQTQILLSKLQSMSYEELKQLWKCNDSIAKLNFQRLLTMDLHHGLTPAVLSYEGIQYQYMAPGVFTDEEFAFIQTHLRILSGFYGLLRPFDGVVPYRLEMQAKLETPLGKDLYAFWGDCLASSLFRETDCILNLASREYSLCVSRYVPANVRFITCVLGEERSGKVVEKGTMCKMARGEMVRFLAEHQITEPEKIKDFHRLNFHFDPERSDSDTFVFIRNSKEERDD